MNRILLLCLVLPFCGFAQSLSTKRFGVSAGLIFTFGSHVNRAGLSLNTYYQDHFYQFNLGTTYTFNLTGYGQRRNFWEMRNSVGLILLAGKKESIRDFQLDGLFHNTAFNYGLGYNYLFYLDNAGTSQLSGGWAAHIKNLSILFENDVFGGQRKDRFRSNHLVVSYKYDELKFKTGLYLWTGETAGSVWEKIAMEKCRGGFRILEDLPYGRTSHGNLYAGVDYNLGSGQFTSFRVGIDSEHIRHAFQNRLIHDQLFLPKRIEQNTPHYPRLNEFGCPVFNKEEVRKDRFYFQQGFNDTWSN